MQTLFSCEENLKNNQDWQRFKKAQEQMKCVTVNIFFQRSNICQQQRFLYSLIYSILDCLKTSGLFKLTACGLIWNSLLSYRGEQVIKGNENCLISLLWQQIHLFVMFCFVTFHLLRIKIVSDYFWVSNFCATPTEMTGSNWIKDRSCDSSLTLWKCLFWAVKKSS